jgi:MerR family redox-sensitive transcriptional activator SoxR
VDEPTLTIGEVAARAGLNASRIRFYERTGVLPRPARVSGQRRYHPEVLRRLAIIDVAQRAGFTLDEIAPLTGPDNRTAGASAHVRALADRKLVELEALIARAQAVRRWLELARECDCERVDVCSLFTEPGLPPRAAGEAAR